MIASDMTEFELVQTFMSIKPIGVDITPSPGHDKPRLDSGEMEMADGVPYDDQVVAIWQKLYPTLYQEYRRMEYNKQGATMDALNVANWEKTVEGKPESADKIQAIRDAVKKKYPKPTDAATSIME